MGQSVLVVAETGSGKSTSIESLDPKETFIVNISNKGLPFPGWKSKYTVWDATTNPTGNMYVKSDPKGVFGCMQYVNTKRPEIKNLIIDDLQYLSGFELMAKAEEKGYDKFTSIAVNLHRVASYPKDMRDDLMVFYLTHVEKSSNMDGDVKMKALTVGKTHFACTYLTDWKLLRA